MFCIRYFPFRFGEGYLGFAQITNRQDYPSKGVTFLFDPLGWACNSQNRA